MRLRDAMRVAAALVCLLPSAASALEWATRIGFLYERHDSWTQDNPRITQPRLDLDLRLDLRGDVVAPGVFAWNGTAGYRLQMDELNGARTSETNALTYRLDLALFRHRRSPFSVTAFADRTDGKFETFGGEGSVGDRNSTSYGGTMRLRPSEFSSLDAGYTRYEIRDTLESLPSHEQNVNTVTGQIAHSAGAFGLGATYRGDFSEGSWVSDDYDSHEANVTASSAFGGDRDVTFVDRFYRRIPSVAGPETFASEINAFRAAYRDGFTPGRTSILAYSNVRASTQAGALSDQSISNSLQYRRDQRLPAEEYFVRGTADVAATDQQRTGVASESSRGGTVGAELWWRRAVETGEDLGPGVKGQRLYELAGGPLVGVVDTDADGIRLGYGATAHARIGAPWRGRQLGALYDLSWANDLFGRPGWSLLQTGTGTISGPAGAGNFTAGLSLAGQRSWTPVFGDGASRSIAANVDYRWFRYSLSGQASLSQGVLPGTNAFLGDGLLIPVGFDTRQTSVGAGAGVRVFSALNARVEGRYAQSVMPGQPDFTISEIAGALYYRYGEFSLSLEDRLNRSEQSNVQFTRNVVFVRVSRTIGSR